ncbi:hypothetical protein ADL26_17965, partial [Thermoactinomyces vulgaris]
KVDRSGPCWIWTAGTNKSNYGYFKVNGEAQEAHRVAFEMLRGPVPEGLHLDHLCHTNDPACKAGDLCLHRRCVNPDHLEPVSKRENIRRGQSGSNNADKTRCPAGHAYDAANTYV